MALGTKLRALRTERGLSLRELGRATHLSHSFIADIEAGRCSASIDTMKALAKALGVDLVRLLDEPRPDFDPATVSSPPAKIDPNDPRVKRLAEVGIFLHTPFELDEQDIKEIEDFIEYRRQKAAKRREREEQQKKGGSPTPG